MRGFKQLWSEAQAHAESREDPGCFRIKPCATGCGGENQHTEGLSTDTAWQGKGKVKRGQKILPALSR